MTLGVCWQPSEDDPLGEVGPPLALPVLSFNLFLYSSKLTWFKEKYLFYLNILFSSNNSKGISQKFLDTIVDSQPPVIWKYLKLKLIHTDWYIFMSTKTVSINQFNVEVKCQSLQWISDIC